MRAILGGERPAGSEPVEVGFFVDDQEQGVLALDPEGLGSFCRDRQDFTARRGSSACGSRRASTGSPGTIVRIFEGLPASYGGANPSKRPLPPPPEFRPPKDATPERLAQAREEFEQAARGERRRPTT